MTKYAVEIKSNLENAILNLQAAKEALQKGQYDLAASRACEVAFYTGSALLLDEEIETSQHGDVISLLHQIFVNGRRLTKEQGENLTWLFTLRNVVTPGGSMPVSPAEAQKAVEVAESFLEAAKVILEA
jgi:uncharacterized protein (UPF0332 family)